MADKVYHVTKDDDQWQVKAEGNKQATSKHDTKAEAKKQAQEHAKNNNGSVVVHKEDGTVES